MKDLRGLPQQSGCSWSLEQELGYWECVPGMTLGLSVDLKKKDKTLKYSSLILLYFTFFNFCIYF